MTMGIDAGLKLNICGTELLFLISPPFVASDRHLFAATQHWASGRDARIFSVPAAGHYNCSVSNYVTARHFRECEEAALVRTPFHAHYALVSIVIRRRREMM
jgi:hypothetical protein